MTRARSTASSPRSASSRFSLIYTQFAVLLVLGYVWLPFVALPIFVSLESLDRRLLEAASDLGASRWQAFFRITLPLSAPGVAAGFLFVFIPTLGEFITPSLVGGTDGYMYGNQIVDLFGTGFPDWRTGSVLALFLLGVVGLLTIVLSASSSRDRWLRTRCDERRAIEIGGVATPDVLRPRRRLPLRADRRPPHLLVQRLGSPDVPPQRLHAPLVPRVPHEPRSAERAQDKRR